RLRGTRGREGKERRGRGGGLAAHGDLDLALRDLGAAERGEELVELRVAGGRGDALVRFAGSPDAMQLLVEHVASRGDVLLEVLVAEPLAHARESAGARAR